MNHKDIQSLLEEALEQEIPSSKINLWPAVKTELAAGNYVQFRQGEKMNPLKRPQIAFALVTIVVLLALAFISPRGRAFAQDVLQFFTFAESDSYYSEPSDMTFEEMTPFHAECGVSIHPTCSVEYVRSKVDFEVKELAILPEAMYFEGATGGPDWIEMAYLHTDRDRLGGELSVMVEPSDKAAPWPVSKTANVEQVQIGNLTGEYQKGSFFQDDYGNVTWQPNDPTTLLRWKDGGSTYTLYYYSTRYPLTKDDLVRLAESMTLEPVAK